jgi:rhodanese-related sulfurtransferase
VKTVRRNDHRAARAVTVAGWVPWALAALLVAMAAVADPTLRPVSPQALLDRAAADDRKLVVLDVRSPEEFAAGHVPGAVNIPYDQVAARLAEVPKDKDLVLYCRSGRRVAIAAEVLAQNGYTRLEHLEGDMPAWLAQGRPTETPKDASACVAALKSGGDARQACAAD